MLDNWTDGRIPCRHSAPTSFLVIIRPKLHIKYAIKYIKDKKAVLSQGNRATPQLFFSV